MKENGEGEGELSLALRIVWSAGGGFRKTPHRGGSMGGGEEANRGGLLEVHWKSSLSSARSHGFCGKEKVRENLLEEDSREVMYSIPS